ncbi:MAG: hypothetical protein VB861_19360 [Planctomycetaceae bacterium]
MSIGQSIRGFRQSQRGRRRSVIGAFLVLLLLACPLLCRAGSCCSGRASSDPVFEASGDVCCLCHRDDQQRQAPVSPGDRGGDGGCLCSGAIVPLLVSVADQQVSTSGQSAARVREPHGLSCSGLREDAAGAADRVSSGWSLCVLHGVLLR